MKYNKKIIFTALLLFFAVRLILFFITDGIYAPKNYPYYDSGEYNGYSLAILKDNTWLRSAKFEGSHREPGYPLFLASIYLLSGKGNFFAVYILQAFINILTIFIIYKLARMIFNETTAVIALFLSGFYSFYIWYIPHLLREILLCFYMASMFYFLYKYLNNDDYRKGAVKDNIKYVSSTALIYALLIHTDSRYLYLMFLVPVLFAIYKPLKQNFRFICLFFLLTFILSVPWAARNYFVYKDFVYVCAHHSEPGINIIKNYKYSERVALKPVAWRNFKRLWLPFFLSEDRIKASKLRPLSLVSNAVVLPFVLIALLRLIIKRSKAAYFLILPIIFHAIIHVFSFSEMRYRLPIDFLVIILAAYGMFYVFNSIGARVQPFRCHRAMP